MKRNIDEWIALLDDQGATNFSAFLAERWLATTGAGPASQTAISPTVRVLENAAGDFLTFEWLV